jgi:hypothetical protein
MGSVTLRPRPLVTPHERRQLVLDLAQRLAARSQHLTLDEIDGEFYWRCCRLDFVAAIAAFERHLSGPPNGDEFLSPLDGLATAYGIPQTAIAAHISHNAPIAIREPALSFHYRDDDLDNEGLEQEVTRRVKELGIEQLGDQRALVVYAAVIDRISVKVPTPTMSGADVARRIELFLAAHERAGQYFCHPTNPAAFSVHIDVDLVTAETEEADLHQSIFLDGTRSDHGRPMLITSYGTIPPPYIRLIVGYPWPPAEQTAAIYDAARSRNPNWVQAWGEGTAKARAQTADVAIRTWAVSLLMAAGVPQDEAMDQVCEVCDLERIARPGWTSQRKLLLQRVPQAARYLYPPRYRPAD